jgi:UDP-N-acetylglucosamine 4,6-dehydratase/5-epimerase
MHQRVLITGGSGFLGRNLAKDLMGAHEVFIGARNNKQNLIARDLTRCTVLPMDVTNIESVRDAFLEARPDVVIHAAATKFVDLAERFPIECIDVNVLGSQNVARVAMEKGIDTVIGVSTDKAAPPIRNTYGLSKAIMERLFCSLNDKSDTKFACVRYGNVAWSTGSVFPIWKKMHDETGVIRSTGPEMRRFFFTVDEAVKLVRTAMDQIDRVQGKILSRQMKAAQIGDLLNTWVECKGGRWERMEGRPGERDDEFLIGDIELPYTVTEQYGTVEHYIISFNQKVEHPLPAGLSSANTKRLTKGEMMQLINYPAE